MTNEREGSECEESGVVIKDSIRYFLDNQWARLVTSTI